MTSRTMLLRALDQAGWTRLSDRVIRGVCHELNGGINNLSSLIFLSSSGASSGAGREAGGKGAVEEELESLETSVRLLRQLPDDGGRGSEVVAPGELLPPLADLVCVQPGLEDVSVRISLPPDTPALRMDPVLLRRIVLLLLTAAAEGARAAGVREVELAASGREGLFRIRPAREMGEMAEGMLDPGGIPSLPARMEGLLAGVLEEVGGELASSVSAEGGTALEVRLPVFPTG